MHFVVMGAGRVGTSVASQLESIGHSVAVIDKNADAFRRLPADFSGKRVTGLGFDRDALRQAGIEEAYAFAAISNGDNSNVIAARVVRETFGVKHVVARIYDPVRAKMYQKLGIPTVGTVEHTTSQMLRWMLPRVSDVVYTDEKSTLQMIREVVSQAWVGQPAARYEEEFDARIAYIVRQGQAILGSSQLAFVENDEVFLLTRKDNRIRAQKGLQDPPNFER